jgi:hypothetical protein
MAIAAAKENHVMLKTDNSKEKDGLLVAVFETMGVNKVQEVGGDCVELDTFLLGAHLCCL